MIALICTLIIAYSMVMGPVHAADGSYTLTGRYAPKVGNQEVNLGTTTFTLYKVGGFGRDEAGKATLRLDAKYGGTDLPEYKSFKDYDTWARDVVEPIRGLVAANPPDFQKTTTTGDGGSFSFSGLENGLYLLTGNSQTVDQGTTSTTWHPQPMLVMILNGNVEIETKPVSETVDRYQVTKMWAGDEDVKDLVRPKEITVKVYYGQVGSAELMYTEKLNDANNWTFEWDTNGATDPMMWYCVEELSPEDARNYSISAQENYVIGTNNAGNRKQITLTNTFSRGELEIVKRMDTYVNHSDSVSTSLVFDITGLDKDGKQVFHKVAGMQYELNSAIEQKLDIGNIPRDVETLKVREIYSGNQKPVTAEQTATRTVGADGKTKFTVTFENKHNDVNYGSGVINKYKMEVKDGKGSYKYDKALGL